MALFIDGKQVLGSLVVEGDLTMPLPTYKTASGSVATFETDMTENLISCVAEIVATQSGSGTPSPSNPRPISGFSACTVTANSTPYVCNLGDTYYGGSVDVVTGKINKVMSDGMDLSSFAWEMTKNDTTAQEFRTTSATGANGVTSTTLPNLLCEIYQTMTRNAQTSTHTANSIGITSTSRLVVVVAPSTYTDANAFRTAMTGIKAVYELATPITAYASNTLEIPTINGTNNLFADTGDISEAKYILSVGEALRQG